MLGVPGPLTIRRTGTHQYASDDGFDAQEIDKLITNDLVEGLSRRQLLLQMFRQDSAFREGRELQCCLSVHMHSLVSYRSM